MTDFSWLKPRKYRHFDVPIGPKFAAKVMQKGFVERHSFSPLIHFEQKTKRYAKAPPFKDKLGRDRIRKITEKIRDIYYCSHRDACILSYYSWQLSQQLEEKYLRNGLGDNVIAYRSLGKSNYHFASEVHDFAILNSPVEFICFDIKGFFDNLAHNQIKHELREILGVSTLSGDWYKIFKYITRFAYVKSDDLEAAFGPSSRVGSQRPWATMEQVKAAEISIHHSRSLSSSGVFVGIPQGTPINATISNLYMLRFDKALADSCSRIGALYRRYSDDILVVCKKRYADGIKKSVADKIMDLGLEIHQDKTKVVHFSSVDDVGSPQYLGFHLPPRGALIRSSSLAKQWRRFKRAARKAEAVGRRSISQGKSSSVFTRKLKRRFRRTTIRRADGSMKTLRNFSNYAQRSSETFSDGKRILKQLRKFNRYVETEISRLKNIT